MDELYTWEEEAEEAEEAAGPEPGEAGAEGDEGAEQQPAMHDEDYEPNEQEIVEYCEWLGMDPVADRQLMWIAREALKAPLPENWRLCYTEERDVYYFNVRTGESIWDHPMDAYYKALYKQEKQKLDRKRKHMRMFSGSLDVKPLVDFFSQVQAESDETNAAEPWKDVPESLIDAIDFNIFVDPVVLPTSGRTVSRRTIINNKWRDPFTREYVENRRLVPNVDKRAEVDNWLAKAVSAYFDALQISDGLPSLLHILPFMLDKDDEMSVRAQGYLLGWFNKHLQPPAAAEQKEAKPSRAASKLREQVKGTNARRTASSPNMAKPSSARFRDQQQQQQPAPATPQQPLLLQTLKGLSEADTSVLNNCLLTMSTSSSREVLLHVVRNVPLLASHSAFRGFSDEILNVIHLNPKDMAAVANTIINNAAAQTEEGKDEDVSFEVTNPDHIVSLRWVHTLMNCSPPVNAIHMLDCIPAVHIALGMYCTKEVGATTTTIASILRGTDGWPAKLSSIPNNRIRLLLMLALDDPSPVSQVTTLYDVCLHGNERCFEAIKAKQSLVMTNIMELAAKNDTPAANLRCVDLLASILVFHEMAALADFEAFPHVAMRVGYNLLPRLTRLQWRPRHFDATVTQLIALVEAHPIIAWGTMQSGGMFFLIKELYKKKRSGDETRSRLESLEAAERQLEQSNAISNWALFSLRLEEKNERRSENPNEQKLAAIAANLEKFQAKKKDVQVSRATNFTSALRILMKMRLKPKQRGTVVKANSTVKADDAPPPQPSTPMATDTSMLSNSSLVCSLPPIA